MKAVRTFAELVAGPFYERDPKAEELIAQYIPSVHDLESEFARQIRAICPAECVAWPAMGRHLLVETSPGIVYQADRQKAYVKIAFPYGAIHSADDGLADFVRQSYLHGARELAGAAGVEAAALYVTNPGKVTVRWKRGCAVSEMNHDGQRRIYLDPNSDTIIALLASCFAVAPVGLEVA